jgi:DNA-binding XRE family transcriptional regulator
MSTATTTAAAPPRTPGKRGPKKAPPLAIFPELPTPSGLEVRELRLAMGWTLEQTAHLIGLTDAQAIGEIERGDRPMTNARWTLMLLAAKRHPTLQVLPLDAAQAADGLLS